MRPLFAVSPQREAVPIAVPSMSTAGAIEAPAVPRNIVIAVDDTDDAQQAVLWAVRNVLKFGDVLHLMHVLRDNRTNEMDVGQRSRAGASWADYSDRQAWVARLADSANEMISRRFVPILAKNHVQYQVDLLKQKGTFSAAGIGELICESAEKMDAELMLVASHGNGILAEFGSVAKYCQENSHSPVLMLPPNLIASKPSVPGQVMVVAFKNAAAIQQAVSFAANNILRSGDAVTLLFIKDEGQSEELDAEATAQAALKDLEVEEPIKLDVEVIQSLGPLETVDIDVGTSICEAVEELEARMVVMLSRRSQNLMQNMLFGSAVTYCVRNCRAPLLIIK